MTLFTVDYFLITAGEGPTESTFFYVSAELFLVFLSAFVMLKIGDIGLKEAHDIKNN